MFLSNKSAPKNMKNLFLTQKLSFLFLGLLIVTSTTAAHATEIVVNQFDTTAEASSYGIAYGNANTFTDVPDLSFSTNDANGNPSSGSLEFVEEYGTGGHAQGAYASYFATPITGLNQITNLSFDLKVDPASALDEYGNAAYFQLAFDNQNYNYTQLYAGNVTTNSANNGWQHFSVGNGGLPLAQFNTASSLLAVILDPYDSNYTNTPGTEHTIMYIDNIIFLTSAAPPPPPTMSILKTTPGLNFVEGSISGQFDRQNIITANASNYSWVGAATPSHPVTYSFNLSQYNAPDLNYHIYFYQTAGAGGASAPDYNQPNVLILQVSPTNGGAIATITWKTNSPNSGTVSNGLFGTATAITNATLTGNWQLQFTSDTGGNLIAPGPVSYPFTIDPGIAANLSNPITVNFGINPSINSPVVLGEDVVVSQISISGVDPLSPDFATTDNFLQDPALDTNTWTVNALTPSSILFIPTNTVYSVDWTLPDTGFALQENTNLTSSGSWTDSGLSTITLFPGRRALMAKNDLPVGNSAFFRLIQRVATQLQVLLPGETNAPNTVSGKVGTPIPQSVSGTGTTVTVNSVDSTWHIVNTSGDQIQLSSSDEGASIPPAAPLEGGTEQFTGFFFGTANTTQTITATDTSNTNILSNTSSTVSVTP
jgi:hypothetical protein